MNQVVREMARQAEENDAVLTAALGPFIEVTVRVPVSEIEEMVTRSYMEIQDRAAFDTFVQTPAFKQKISEDLLDIWELTNDDSDACDIILDLFEASREILREK